LLIVLVVLDLLLQGYFRKIGFGVLNRGVSFGLLPGAGQGVSIAVYLVLIIFLGLVKLTSGKSIRLSPALWLLVAGGFGNLLPRLFWSGVWDYIQVPPFPFWLNLSDLMITTGLVSYILRGDGNSDSL
jgi:lipoprotein signal peptidase